MLCAREMRGSASIANAVSPLRRQRGDTFLVMGLQQTDQDLAGRICPSSSAFGARTLSTMSASR